MSGTEIIDRDALAGLLETTGGDPEFLAELIDSYFEDTPALLTTLRDASATGDATAFRRAAHTLKSTSATFGATGLEALGRQLETLGHGGDLTGADALAARAEAEYARVHAALAAIRDEA